MRQDAVVLKSVISVNIQSRKPVNGSFPTNSSLVSTYVNSLKRRLNYILAAT